MRPRFFWSEETWLRKWTGIDALIGQFHFPPSRCILLLRFRAPHTQLEKRVLAMCSKPHSIIKPSRKLYRLSGRQSTIFSPSNKSGWTSLMRSAGVPDGIFT